MGLLKSFSVKNNIIYFIIALLLLVKCKPYFVWGMPEVFNLLVSVIFAILTFSYIDVTEKKRFYIFSLLAFSYFLLSLFRGAQLGALLNMSLAVIPFIKQESFFKIYNSFRLVLSIVFLISIISLITVLLGLQSSNGIIDPLNDVKSYGYIEYFMLVVPTLVEDMLPRFCSAFDEPGVVGTMCGLLLISENFKFRDWSSYIFLIAGLLSFSLYFYLIVIAFLFFKSSTKYKFIIVMAIIVFFFATRNNEIFYDRIWGRLEFEDGNMSGNNRNTDDFIYVWDKSKYSPQILWGYGFKLAEIYSESSSIQLFIYRDGIIFVLLYLLSYFIYTKLYCPKKFTYVIFLVIFATLYQRPGFCEAEFSFLFTSIILNHSKYASLSSRSVI